MKHQSLTCMLTVGVCVLLACGVEQDDAPTFRSFDGAAEPADGLHLSSFAREVDGQLEVLCVKPDWVSDEEPGAGFVNPEGGWVSFTLLDLNEDPPTPWEDRVRTSSTYVMGQESVSWLVDMPPTGHYALGCEALPTNYVPAESGFEWMCPVPDEPGETGICTRSAPYYFSVTDAEPPSGEECGQSTQLCTGMLDWAPGSYPYYVICGSLQSGVVHLQADSDFEGRLRIDTPDDLGVASVVDRGNNACLDYSMPEFVWDSPQDPVCRVVLEVEQPGRARLSGFAPDKGPDECRGRGPRVEPGACGGDVPIFDLPFAGEGRISQGNFNWSHNTGSSTQYAVDFDLPKDHARSPVDGFATVGTYQTNGYGPNVILIEPDGMPDTRLLIGHCDDLTGTLANATPGKRRRVKAGDIVCKPGNEGFTSGGGANEGIHIHFHVLEDSDPMNDAVEADLVPVHYGLRFKDLGPELDPIADPFMDVHCTNESELDDGVVSSGGTNQALQTWHRVESAL